MKRKALEARISAYIQFDVNFVTLMRDAALRHYSGDCHAAAEPGGFLWGAMNLANWAAEKNEEAERSFTFREIDLMLKIIELEDGPEYAEIRKILWECIHKINDMSEYINGTLLRTN